VAQIVSQTDWRYRSRNEALLNEARETIARPIVVPRTSVPRRETTSTEASQPAVWPISALRSVELPDEAVRADALCAIPGRMLVDLHTREVSVELPWLDFRRHSTSASGIDVDLNDIVDRRIGLGLAGNAGAKRAFDVVATFLSAPLWLPLLVFLALLVKCTSRGKAFYVQERVGRDGRVFRCVKLRTMASDAERRLQLILSSDPGLRSEYEANFKLRRDPRITRIGRALRKSGLDELPQLIAVLRGHMSLVGPRPIVPLETEYYGPYLPLVQTARPGLTGLWQVSGRNDLAYPLRVALDIEYVLTRTFWSDVMTVLRTLLLVFRPSRRGAY
jgi:lipopolysaccharide/colanic/teichoic acid biosynthesis glycosyltransferase